MTATPSQFWDDLAKDLEDPEFLREYIRESVRIATIDNLVNELDEARQTAGLTKAELARAMSAEPAVVRRFFSAGHVNPTVGTLTAVAAALGMRLTLEPLSEPEREQITRPLMEGGTAAPVALAKHASEMRERKRATLAS
jgi:transcriptional regulator with XRE-family HTH domain